MRRVGDLLQPCWSCVRVTQKVLVSSGAGRPRGRASKLARPPPRARSTTRPCEGSAMRVVSSTALRRPLLLGIRAARAQGQGMGGTRRGHRRPHRAAPAGPPPPPLPASVASTLRWLPPHRRAHQRSPATSPSAPWHARLLGLRLRAPRRLSERARWLAMRVGGFWHRGTNDGEAVAALVA